MRKLLTGGQVPRCQHTQLATAVLVASMTLFELKGGELMQRLHWKSGLLVLAIWFAIASVGISAAQQSSDKDTTHAQVQAFEEFLDGHPAIAPDLKKNPSLVNDAGYVNSHPELAAFLQSHPKLAEELKENPSAFMSAEHNVQKGENPANEETAQTQREQALDQFLDAHPAIAKELRSNPSLVNDASYLQSHRELANFLETHPHIKAELSQNPGAFLKASERGEGPEGRQHKDKDKNPH